MMNPALPQRLSLLILAIKVLPSRLHCAMHFATECARLALLCAELGHLLCPEMHGDLRQG